MNKTLLSTKPYIGTRDFYPNDMQLRNWFFSKMRNVVEGFGYNEISGPLVEMFDIFAAKSGEEIVKQQIYHLTDRGERHIAIRPEMTPTVARMVAAKMEEFRFPIRWYSIANFMRYERPQRGRLREFYQLNVDLLGVDDFKADLEIICLVIEIMKEFGADSSMFIVKINNRRLFNEVMQKIINIENSKIQTVSRIIDKRFKMPPDKYSDLLNNLGFTVKQIDKLEWLFNSGLEEITDKLVGASEGVREINELFDLLNRTGYGEYCEFDFSIVRGLDYYTGNVFEVYDRHPENRRALFGGGRYDDLIGLFKNKKVSGVGFGLGDVTFQNFVSAHGLIPRDSFSKNRVLITVFEDVPFEEYISISAELRKEGISNSIYLGNNMKFQKQLQYAEKEGYRMVIILGAKELNSQRVLLKNLDTREQFDFTRSEYIKKILEIFEAMNK